MPDYEFCCVTEDCEMKDVVVLRWFHMNDVKSGSCETCGKHLKRILGNFIDQYKGEGFTRSADAKEEVDVWKAKGE